MAKKSAKIEALKEEIIEEKIELITEETPEEPAEALAPVETPAETPAEIETPTEEEAPAEEIAEAKPEVVKIRVRARVITEVKEIDEEGNFDAILDNEIRVGTNICHVLDSNGPQVGDYWIIPHDAPVVIVTKEQAENLYIFE